MWLKNQSLILCNFENSSPDIPAHDNESSYEIGYVIDTHNEY